MPEVTGQRAFCAALAGVALLTLVSWPVGPSAKALSAAPADGPTRPIVVFRYDDYANWSPYAVDRAVIEAFTLRGLQCTVAVVPCQKVRLDDGLGTELRPLVSEKVELLRDGIEVGAVDVALHGLTHLPVYPGQDSEFRGLSLERQIRRITAGKAALEDALGTNVVTFIPPGNSYDANTLTALEQLGFACISAQRSKSVFAGAGISVLPRTCGLGRLRRAVKRANRVADRQPIIVVLFHPDSFFESDSKKAKFALQEFADSLDWVAGQNWIEVLSIGQLLERGVRLDEDRLAANIGVQVQWAPRIVRAADKGLYYPAAAARSARRAVMAKALFAYCVELGVCAVVAFVLALRAGSRRAGVVRLVRCAVLVALVCAAVYAAIDRKIEHEEVQASVALLGFLCGLVVASSGLRRTAPRAPAGAPEQPDRAGQADDPSDSHGVC